MTGHADRPAFPARRIARRRLHPLRAARCKSEVTFAPSDLCLRLAACGAKRTFIRQAKTFQGSIEQRAGTVEDELTLDPNVEREGASTTAMRRSGPMRTAIMPLATNPPGPTVDQSFVLIL